MVLIAAGYPIYSYVFVMNRSHWLAIEHLWLATYWLKKLQSVIIFLTRIFVTVDSFLTRTFVTGQLSNKDICD